MRKLLILLGLVLGIGWGGTALAQSGSDSSGTHSYSLECGGISLHVTNTGQGMIRFLYQSETETLNPGESRNLGRPGIDTGPPGTPFEVYFEDPAGSGNFVGLDAGTFPECLPDEESEYSSTSTCVDGEWVVTNTGDGEIVVVFTSYPSLVIPEGGSIVIPEGINSAGGYYADESFIDLTRPECDTPPPPDDVSYTLECVGEDLIFSNTGARTLNILVSLGGGQPVYTVGAGESENFGTPGEDTGFPGTRYEVWFEDPSVPGGFRGLEEGRFPDCINIPEEPENPTYSATAEIVCAGPQIQVNNTGTGHFLVWDEMTDSYELVFAGGSQLIPWVTDAAGNLDDPMGWDARPPGVGAGFVDGGQFTLAELAAACDEEPTEPYTYTVECDTGTAVFHNTSPVVEGNLQSGLLFVTHEAGGVAAVIAGSTLFMVDGEDFTVEFQDPAMPAGDYTFLDSGTAPTCEGEDLEPPALISECDGTDWYIVHPGGNQGNWQYRLTDGTDIVTLYDADYNTSNPPAENAFFGEVLVPEEINEVNYVDDFNGTGTLTRPDCTTGGGGGGGGTTTTTPPPTTAAPTEPTTPGEVPATPAALAPIVAEGFVAPGSSIGPGEVTFGVAGFAPGEVVTVTLFSTPRELGTVTATDSGNATITFEVLASDGAGEHRVQFSGPSGTFSVPFTLVLPAQSLPETR